MFSVNILYVSIVYSSFCITFELRSHRLLNSYPVQHPISYEVVTTSMTEGRYTFRFVSDYISTETFLLTELITPEKGIFS